MSRTLPNASCVAWPNSTLKRHQGVVSIGHLLSGKTELVLNNADVEDHLRSSKQFMVCFQYFPWKSQGSKDSQGTRSLCQLWSGLRNCCVHRGNSRPWPNEHAKQIDVRLLDSFPKLRVAWFFYIASYRFTLSFGPISLPLVRLCRLHTQSTQPRVKRPWVFLAPNRSLHCKRRQNENVKRVRKTEHDFDVPLSLFLSCWITQNNCFLLKKFDQERLCTKCFEIKWNWENDPKCFLVFMWWPWLSAWSPGKYRATVSGWKQFHRCFRLQ